MTPLPRISRAVAAVAAGTAALALLVACSTGSQPNDTATQRGDPAFPRFTTDPEVPVVSDLVYGITDDGSRLLADVCLPPTGPDTADGQRDPSSADDETRRRDDGVSGTDDGDAGGPAPSVSPTPGTDATTGDQGAAPPSGAATGSATGSPTAAPDSDGGTSAAADDEIPDDATPGIVMVHGGSWERGSKSTLAYRATCQWLARATGYPVVNIDYRLAPAHPYPAGADDVDTAIEWMRQPDQVQRFHIDPDRIGAFGGSAGANLVALTGTRGDGALDTGSRVAAVVELSGPVDLTGAAVDPRFVPFEQAYTGCADLASCPTAHEASPYFHLDRSDPPFLVAHAQHDPVIPYAQSTRFVTKLRATGIDTVFVRTRGSAHSIAQLPGNDRLRARIVSFFQTRLSTASGSTR